MQVLETMVDIYKSAFEDFFKKVLSGQVESKDPSRDATRAGIMAIFSHLEDGIAVGKGLNINNDGTH